MACLQIHAALSCSAHEHEQGRSWLETDEGQTWLEGRSPAGCEGGDEDKEALVAAALALIKATLQFNGLTLEDGFSEFDQDMDGRVTLTDIDNVIGTLAIEMTSAHAHALFEFLDKDADGYVEPGDWVAALESVDAAAELAARGLAGESGKAPELESGSCNEGTVVKDAVGKKQSIVSPVGQYIKTGELPVARVRGSTSSMGTIRESTEGHVRSSGRGVRRSVVRASGGTERGSAASAFAEDEVGEEEEYEDYFDEEFEDEEEDLYSSSEQHTCKGDSLSLHESLQTQAPVAAVSSARPASARCSDALDFQRRMQGVEEEEILEEQVEEGELEEACGEISDVDEVVEDGEVADGDVSFEAAAHAQYSCWTEEQTQGRKIGGVGGQARVLSASHIGQADIMRRAPGVAGLRVHPASAGSRRSEQTESEDVSAVLAAIARENSTVVSSDRGNTAIGDGLGNAVRAVKKGFPRIPSAKAHVQRTTEAGVENAGEVAVGEESKLTARLRDLEQKKTSLQTSLQSSLGGLLELSERDKTVTFTTTRAAPGQRSKHRYSDELEEEEEIDKAIAGVEDAGHDEACGVQGQVGNEVVVEVLSNWGHDKMVGLTQVELFDKAGGRIKLARAQVCSRGFRGLTDKTHLLIGKTFLTTDEADMWSAYLPLPGSVGVPSIVFFLEEHVELGAMRIWNYNKSVLDVSKGVRCARVLVRGASIWEGELIMGGGDTHSDYTTTICVNEMGEDVLEKLPALPFGASVKQDTDCKVVEEAVHAGIDNGVQTQADRPWLPTSGARVAAVVMPTPASAGSRGKTVKVGLYDLEDPDMLPAGLAASRQRPRGGGGLVGFDTVATGGSGPGGEGGSTEPVATVKAGRRKGRKYTDVEKSLDSLSFFRQSHMGRLGLLDAYADLDDESYGQKHEDVTDGQRSRKPSAGRRAEKADAGHASLSSADFACSRDVEEWVTFSDASFYADRTEDCEDTGDGMVAKAEDAVVSSSPCPSMPASAVNVPAQGVGELTEDGKSEYASTGRGEGMDLSRKLHMLGLPHQEEEASHPAYSNPDSLGALDDCVQPVTTKVDDAQQEHERAASVIFPVQEEVLSPPLDAVDHPSPAPGRVPVHEGMEIPLLPRGQVLSIYIWSTWGDTYYVGLNGVEVFDSSGALVELDDAKSQITANPPDINVLEGYGSDPRTVDNLMVGPNNTCDDLNVWLAPFNQGQVNEVVIDLGSAMDVAMVRVWNYNKSRIHAARGARHVEFFLDGAPIFAGELKCAPGNLHDAESCAEVVLFTEDEHTLVAIADSLDVLRQEALETSIEHHHQQDEDAWDELEASIENVLASVRPSTPCEMDDTLRSSAALAPALQVDPGAAEWVNGRQIEIVIVDTWGDMNYVGLTGLQVLLRGGITLPITDEQVTATPRDLNEIPGNSGDPRTKDKLVNGTNLTCDDRNMWLVPYTRGGMHKLVVELGQEPVEVSAVRLWNYNKSHDDATRGAKTIHISIDGARVSPPTGLTLRKAPGNASYDFGHTFALGHYGSVAAEWATPQTASEHPVRLEKMMGQCRQDSYPPALPRGLTLCVELTATHGDLYYVGLNGLELYDDKGARIPVRPQQIACVPASINELDGVVDDCRTADKLVDTCNTTWDAVHMWLTPFSRMAPARVFCVFDEPVTLSMIKFWNYARTPSRGAAETYIWVDGSLVYSGYLRSAPPSPSDPSSAVCFGQSVLLHATAALLDAERRHVFCSDAEQHCLLVNERKIVEGEEIVMKEKAAVAAVTAAARAGEARVDAVGAAGGALMRPSTSVLRK